MSFPWLLLAVALSALATRAAAQGDAGRAAVPAPETRVSACVEDHKLVQTARESGHFLLSREAAARCAQASCPRLIREDCAAWYMELEQHTPSLVIDVRNPAGRDVAEPRVTMGARVLDVDGRAIAFDPGTHELRVEAPGFEPLRERVVLHQGERNRRLTLTLQPSSALPASQPGLATSPAVIGLGAVGLSGLGTFAALAVAGRLRQSDLDDDGCKPSCDRRDVDGVNRMYLGANIAAAIGGAAALAATVSYVRARRRARPFDVALGPLGVNLRGVF